MPRANRISCQGLVWHITHRCHKKSFLLKFSKDRKRWRHWLYVSQRRYDLSVLNYIATSNHIHLLVADQGRREISAAMQLLASRTAQEFNNRKNRRGAFWEDRYHATAVQTDGHLAQCMTYIDLNMVRAAVVKTPIEWDVSGYAEIQRPWKRIGIIDFARLRQLLDLPCDDALARQREVQVREALNCSRRQAAWTEAVGVGDERFLKELKVSLGAKAFQRRTTVSRPILMLREVANTYFADSGQEKAICTLTKAITPSNSLKFRH